jgi:hypothetical protein
MNNNSRLIGLLACALMATSPTVARADLVGLWRFDADVSPQPDSSGNGHSGEPNGDVTWVNDAELGGGVMEFDGDLDYLEVEDTDLLSIEGDMTIAAWARFESFDNWNSIVSKTGLPELNNHNRPAPYDLYTVFQGAGTVRFYVGDGADGIGFFDGFDIPELETWVHIAVTITEEGDVVQYLNGENNGEGFVDFPRIDLDQNLFIGGRADFVTNMFGRLDDVAIFNEVLEEAQVQTIMGGDFSAWIEGGGVTGDFDNSGVLDEADLNLLTAEINGNASDLQYDVNSDGAVNTLDHSSWVTDLRNTWIGDANLDNEFNTADLVQVLSRGKYEDGVAQNAQWGDGDWNADLEFDTADLVAALAGGGYESGPRAATLGHAVPEPATGWILLSGLWLFHVVLRRRR